MNNLGVGAEQPGEVTPDDDIYEQYKKRMMLGYKFRPNPLVRRLAWLGGLVALSFVVNPHTFVDFVEAKIGCFGYEVVLAWLGTDEACVIVVCSWYVLQNNPRKAYY